MKFATQGQMTALPQKLSYFDTGKEKSKSCARLQGKDQTENLSDAQTNALRWTD